MGEKRWATNQVGQSEKSEQIEHIGKRFESGEQFCRQVRGGTCIPFRILISEIMLERVAHSYQPEWSSEEIVDFSPFTSESLSSLVETELLLKDEIDCF